MRCLRMLSIGLLGSVLCAPTLAADVFTITINVQQADCPPQGCNDVIVSGSNAEEVIDVLRLENLAAAFREANSGLNLRPVDSVVQGAMDFRGVPIQLNFPTSGDDQLDFIIHELELSETFNGGNRDQSIEDFKDFLKSNEGDIVSRLYRLLARRSPTDPIAGNPASAQSQAASRDFQQGFTHKVSQVWGCASSAANEQIMLAKAGFGCAADVADLNFRLPAVEMAQIGQTQLDAGSEGLYEDYYERMARERGRNQASIGIEYAQISAQQGGGGDKLKSSMFTLPLAYTVIFDRDPRHKLAFRMPISVVDVEGASVFQAALGVGYTHALSSRWTLTPNLGYTVVGSEDLAAASALLSYSLTSSFTLDVKGWAINIGNMLGNYSTQKLKIADYESDPGISNTVMTNGLMVSGPGSLLANDLVLEYFINDTRYSGDDLFTDNAQEFGVNIGRIRTRGEVITSYVKAGVSYLTASGEGGNKADALRVSISYRF